MEGRGEAMGAVQVSENKPIDMRILYRENLLCVVDQVPERLQIGSIIRVGDNGGYVRVEYIDRSRNEVGILPVESK